MVGSNMLNLQVRTQAQSHVPHIILSTTSYYLWRLVGTQVISYIQFLTVEFMVVGQHFGSSRTPSRHKSTLALVLFQFCAGSSERAVSSQLVGLQAVGGWGARSRSGGELRGGSASYYCVKRYAVNIPIKFVKVGIY